MIKDKRPYYIKQAWYRLQAFYVRQYLEPQLRSLGPHPYIIKPWYIELFGGPISIGSHVTLLGCSDKKTRLTVWSEEKDIQGICIGNHVLISPGVRISAANSITIGDSCMLASHAYVTDSDWHGIYDRSLPPDTKTSVVLEDNVWIGDSAIVCKGVTIGENSIIGAGSVVTSDIPANVIAAGNPAKIVRKLDVDREMITRKDRYSDTREMTRILEASEKAFLDGNTLFGWLRTFFAPKKETP
ncbi:MAG: acyltransferase [Desulfobacter sp.]|nr:acyltransferase [Desulfobacter sp.]WDP83916.1 MAG: acyltransferase [Desulfobacter sp.]